MSSFKQYRAPSDNDSALVDPTWSQQLDQLRTPSQLPTLTVGGLALARLAAQARRDLLTSAQRYTSAYADVESDSNGPLVISGHQPELFHPGVWFKNFALDSLAKASGGVGVHLLIDSDLCRETTIRTPTGSIETPRLESVAYDTPTATVPYEERTVQDQSLFDSFADRVVSKATPLVPEPLIDGTWPHAIESRGRDSHLGRVLSEARHRVERSWGATTRELPFSQVADAESFRRFAAELLLRSHETASACNEALAEYRTAHRLRNLAQPLPDLVVDGAWTEMPLWIWSDKDPSRRALYVRTDAGGLILSDRNGWSAEGPLDADGVVGWLAQMRTEGIKIRSRALATTLYCRLVLADLFLHGIGGAKYDQVTDRFSEKLFGVVPPPHATLTATLRLPIEHDSPTEQDRLALVQRLRELRYHPERFLPDDSDDELLAAAERKHRWIDRHAATDRAERHAQIVAANKLMSDGLTRQRQQTEQDLLAMRGDLRDAALLDSREYSFCLFPADDIRQRLTQLSTIPRDA